MIARVDGFLAVSDLINLSDAVNVEFPPRTEFEDALVLSDSTDAMLSSPLGVNVGDAFEDVLRLTDDTDFAAFALNRASDLDYLRRYLNDVKRGIGRS